MRLDARTAWRLIRTRPLRELPGRVGRFVRRQARAARRRRDFRRGAFNVDDRELTRSMAAGRDPAEPFTFALGVAPLDDADRARFAADLQIGRAHV